MTYSAAVLMLKAAGIPSVKYYVMSLTGLFLLDIVKKLNSLKHLVRTTVAESHN